MSGRVCASCGYIASALDADGWCWRCCTENGWGFTPEVTP